MMAGIAVRRQGTPIEDVIGLDLGPIYDDNHPGIVHVVPLQQDAYAVPYACAR